MFSADSPFPNPNLLPGFLEDVSDLDHVLGLCQDAVTVHKLMHGDSLPNSGLSPPRWESSGLVIF